MFDTLYSVGGGGSGGGGGGVVRAPRRDEVRGGDRNDAAAAADNSGARDVSTVAALRKAAREAPPGIYCRAEVKGCNGIRLHDAIPKGRDNIMKWRNSPFASNVQISKYPFMLTTC